MAKISCKSLKKEIDTFRALFFHPRKRCRKNFACQQEDGTYRPGKGKLTDALLLAHLKGELTLGVYQLDCADLVKWMAFDLDQYQLDGGKKPSGSDVQNWTEEFKNLILDLHSRACRQGRRAYLSTSGRKGAHLYIFFNTLIPAARARYLGEQILQGVEPPPGVTIELFPRQIRKGEGLGSLIKCPWSVHRVTGNRTHFINRRFELIQLKPSEVRRNSVDQIPEGKVDLPQKRKEVDFVLKDDLPMLFKKLLEEDSRIKQLYRGKGKKKGEDQSRSGYDWSLLGALILRGLDDPDDLATILWHRGKNPKSRDPGGLRYLKTTLNKALSQFNKREKKDIEISFNDLRRKFQSN